MLSAQEIYERLEARRSEMGISQAEIGRRAFGRADNAPMQALRRGSLPSVQKLEALCNAVGWELYFGPPRNAPGFSEAAAKLILPSIDGSPEALREGFRPVPFHEEACPGSGLAPIAFSRTWLRQVGTDPDHACVILVPATHAGCGISPGDIALLDEADRDDLAGALYAYFPGALDQVHFANLYQTDTGAIIAASGRPEGMEQIVPQVGFRVIGRVVWFGRSDPH